MKMILALTAAVIVASTGVAAAKTKTSVISLGGKFCVTATVIMSNGVSITANEARWPAGNGGLFFSGQALMQA
jgi:hypothetical protein